jgi:hypothetical protein
LQLFATTEQNGFTSPCSLAATFTFYSVLIPYRIFLHPLSKFPGPKLAAATPWYKFYYDVILQGNYTFKIMDLHKENGFLSSNSFPNALSKQGSLIHPGPIIRINPFELLINDPDYYEILYSQNNPLEKALFYIPN